MAKAAREPKVVFHSTEGPTAERIMRSCGFYEIGGEDRASQKYTMQDSPLDRLMARRAIDPVEYSALRKYAHHWYHGGLQSSVGSVDLNRIFASDPLSMSGMAKSEGQAHHRQQYRNAKLWLEKANPSFDPPESFKDINNYEHKMGIVVDNVILCEWSLDVAGHSIGYQSPFRARKAAAEMLRDAGYRLSKLWGLG